RLSRHVFGREMCSEHTSDLVTLTQVGKAPVQANEHPVAMHGRMPVVAAVKRGVQGLRSLNIGRPAHDMVGLVRVLPVDSLERKPGERRGLLFRQLQAWLL